MSALLETVDLDPPRPTATDLIFDSLYDRILTLDLPPGARMSEAEVARALGVSRQPVRDAFWRLSKLGFLTVRPQRATTVSPISEDAVRQAQFIRTSVEAETIRVAVARLTEADLDALDVVLDRQAEAVAAREKERFHALDEAFHREICERAGLGFAWALVRENKAQMDRARFLSLSFGLQTALNEHRVILDALRARDEAAAVAAMRVHLGRILLDLPRIRADNGRYFGDED